MLNEKIFNAPVITVKKKFSTFLNLDLPVFCYHFSFETKNKSLTTQK